MAWKISYEISDEEKAILDAIAATKGVTTPLVLGGLIRSTVAQLRRQQMMAQVEVAISALPTPAVAVEEVGDE